MCSYIYMYIYTCIDDDIAQYESSYMNVQCFGQCGSSAVCRNLSPRSSNSHKTYCAQGRAFSIRVDPRSESVCNLYCDLCFGRCGSSAVRRSGSCTSTKGITRYCQSQLSIVKHMFFGTKSCISKIVCF